MPPTRSSRHSSAKSDHVTIIFKYRRRRLLVPTPSDYRGAVALVMRHICCIPQNRVRFLAKVEDFEDEVEITSDAWHLVARNIRSFTVVDSKEDDHSDCAGDARTIANNLSSADGAIPSVAPQPPIVLDSGLGLAPISIIVLASNGVRLDFRVSPSAKVQIIYEAIIKALGHGWDDVRLIYNGRRLNSSPTLSYYRMEDGDTIDAVLNQVGGKPVIYLYPPTPLYVRVKLALVHQWNFSAVYPVVDINQTEGAGQTIEWSVLANPNGTLLDKKTGTEVSYLFWEAETQPLLTAPDSPLSVCAMPPPTNSQTQLQVDQTFVPGQSRCTPQNSVLIQIDAVASYLDKALLGLGLHTEARTSFITYWLPSLLKHKCIALRFLPQLAYEPAATLNIDPPPEVITRVFMLFQGISPHQVDAWNEAQQRATEDAISVWKHVVGVDEEKQQDERLFRVLEWGGMEVF